MTSDDDRFAILAKERRRTVLECLVAAEDPVVPFEELVDAVVEAEAGDELGAPDHRRSVAISLRHSDLPRMAEAGVLSFDPDRNVVRYDGAPRLEAILDLE